MGLYKIKVRTEGFKKIKTTTHTIYIGLFLNNNCDVDTSLIPKEQIDDIYSYKHIDDINKRLIARQKLYLFLQTEFNFERFDLIFNSYKKPQLKYLKDMNFSISYSGKYILIGLSKNNIGVDIEKLNTNLNIDELSKSIMHKNEYDYYMLLSGIEKYSFFYQAFNIKESIIKAIGKGFYYDVSSIDTTSIKVGKNTYLDEHIINLIDIQIENDNEYRGNICYFNSQNNF